MCKNKNILFLSLVFLVYLNGCKEPINHQTAINYLKEDVNFLASDLLEGRETGSEGAKKAANYIASRFKEIGLTSKGTEGYFQEFSFSPKKNPHAQPVENDSIKIIARNVIGFIDNQSENTIIIGAHFDHLGFGDDGSLYKGDPAIHNGADDNASGVAALILLAEVLKDRNLNNNYLFITFSGEEKGLFGSNYFSKNPTVSLENVNYMINMDMVGRLNEENALAINGVGTSPAWLEHLEDIGIDSCYPFASIPFQERIEKYSYPGRQIQSHSKSAGSFDHQRNPRIKRDHRKHQATV